MKPKSRRLTILPFPTRLVLGFGLTLAAFSQSAKAGDQTYDATNANNVWDLSTLNWDASAAAWTNGNNATFAGTAESVAVNAAITVANLTFSSNGYTIAPGTGTLGLVAGTSTVSVSTGTSTISSVLGGTGALSKSGTGALSLTGLNTYSGGTTVATGTGTVLVAGAGTGTVGAPTAGALGTGTITLSGGTLQHSAATVIYNNITATAATSSVLADGASGVNFDISGNISGSGNIAANTNNTGFDGVRLLGDNSGFSGTFTFNTAGNARHKFASANAGSAAGKWVLFGGTDSCSMAFGATGTINFGELSGTASGIRNNSTGTATLSVGALGTSSTWGGVLTNVGTLALTKVGAGTLTVTAANTYTGATTINGGKLDVTTGTIANSDVTVNTTGTFQLGAAKTVKSLAVTAGGTAKFGGSATVTNAASASGANSVIDLVNASAASSLTAASLALGGATGADTAKLNLEVGGVTSDLVSVSGALAVAAGGASITVTDLGVQANQTYTLMSFGSGSGAGYALGTGTTVGAITLANPSLAFGVSGTLEVTANNIILHTTGAAAPNEAYWSGAKGTNWSDNSAGQGNFRTGVLVSAPFLATNPGAATQVFFSNNTATNLSNTLGGNFDIFGLTYRGTSAAVTTTGSQQLTLEAGGITLESGNGGATLGMANLVLAQSQTWTNDSSNPLTVSATTVSGPVAALTLAGTGNVLLGGSTLNVAYLDIGANLDVKGTSVTADLLDSSKNITNTGVANSTINANVSFAATLSGVISDSGAGAAISITKGSSGSLTLGGANSYTGTTTLAAGTLVAGNDSAFGTGLVSITSATGIVDLNGKTISNEFTNSGTGAVITNSSTATATVSNGFNPAGAAGFVISDFTLSGTGDIIWNGAIRRTNTVGTLTKSGNNTVTINGASVFGGMALKVEAGTVFFGKTATSIQDLTINGGTLKMDPNYQTATASIWAGTIANTVVMNGGTWDLNDSGTNGVSNRVKRINGTGGLITNSGTATGVLVLAARDGVANNPTWAGSLQDGTGKVALTIANGGSAGTTMTFSGNNTYSGATTIIDNTMRAASITGFSPNSAYSLSNSINSKLELTTFDNSIGSLAGGANSAVILGSATLTTGADGTSTSYAGVISGTGSLVKSGAGTQTLTGLNTYTGTTTVTAGTLSISQAYLADASSVTIGASGKLALTFAGADTVSSLTVAGTPAPAGTSWGATGSGATNIDDTHFSGTGKLVVGATYGTWATTNAGGQAANLDFDNDGVSNGVEYFMGATGSTFTANPGIVNGKVTWPKDPAFSGTYTVQTSPDLATWTNVSSTVVGNTVEYMLPTGQGKFFVRLDVTPN